MRETLKTVQECGKSKSKRFVLVCFMRTQTHLDQPTHPMCVFHLFSALQGQQHELELRCPESLADSPLGPLTGEASQSLGLRFGWCCVVSFPRMIMLHLPERHGCLSIQSLPRGIVMNCERESVVKVQSDSKLRILLSNLRVLMCETQPVNAVDVKLAFQKRQLH